MKGAPYFSHDANARHDSKIIPMRTKYGSEGYGWYWMLVEMMREEGDYRLRIDDLDLIRGYATQLDTDARTLRRFITDCSQRFMLFTSEDGFVWSESLRERMKPLDNKREQGKRAAEKRWAAERGQCEGNAGAMPPQCKGNAINIEDIEEEDKEDSSKNEPPPDDFANIPETIKARLRKWQHGSNAIWTGIMQEVANDTPEEWILAAIDASENANACNLNYLRGAIKGIKADGGPGVKKPRKCKLSDPIHRYAYSLDVLEDCGCEACINSAKKMREAL